MIAVEMDFAILFLKLQVLAGKIIIGFARKMMILPAYNPLVVQFFVKFIV